MGTSFAQTHIFLAQHSLDHGHASSLQAFIASSCSMAAPALCGGDICTHRYASPAFLPKAVVAVLRLQVTHHDHHAALLTLECLRTSVDLLMLANLSCDRADEVRIFQLFETLVRRRIKERQLSVVEQKVYSILPASRTVFVSPEKLKKVSIQSYCRESTSSFMTISSAAS